MVHTLRSDSSRSPSPTSSVTPTVVIEPCSAEARQKLASWERANAQSGGLLDWALAEMADVPSMPSTTSTPRTNSPLLLRGQAPTERGKPRHRLTREDAAVIYLARLGSRSHKKATRLAAEFGITPKAVRDVWARKTWVAETMCVWGVTECKDLIPPGVSSATMAVSAARVRRALIGLRA